MIGQQVGPYNIIKLLGRGGMGIVYQGMHAKLEQLVAMKVLSPEFSANLEMRERFMREAKLQVKLSHPNVVNILNYLEDSKSVYLVMEYVEGESLERRLKEVGALEPSECCRIALGVLDALAFMHQRGIIHRDIKPSNIMLTEGGQIKVTDFGIAKASGEKGLTRTGTQLGTVWYMSPEQVRGQDVDATSDMYALGVTLYQMVTGQVPFHSDSEFEIMKAHVEEMPLDPAAINPKIPRDLGDVILKALAKSHEDRFQSAEEFRHALLHITEAPGSETGMASEPSLPVQDAAFSGYDDALGTNVAQLGTAGEERLFLRRFDMRVWYLLMGMALVLVALLTYIYFRPHPQPVPKGPTIPLTVGPPSTAGTAASSNLTAGNGPQTSEPSLNRNPMMSGVPSGPNQGPTTTSGLPQEQLGVPPAQPTELAPSTQTPPEVAPTRVSMPDASPMVGLPENPGNEELVQPKVAPQEPAKPQMTKESKKKKRIKSARYSRHSSRRPAKIESPAAYGGSTSTVGQEPGGKNKGWGIIK